MSLQIDKGPGNGRSLSRYQPLTEWPVRHGRRGPNAAITFNVYRLFYIISSAQLPKMPRDLKWYWYNMISRGLCLRTLRLPERESSRKRCGVRVYLRRMGLGLLMLLWAHIWFLVLLDLYESGPREIKGGKHSQKMDIVKQGHLLKG